MEKKEQASGALVPFVAIGRRIYSMRSHHVMLDSDLAELYGVTTKRLNEQVKRNRLRFPPDFMFQLTPEELRNWRSQIATSNPKAKMALRRPPYAFTEHGAVMLASVLNSPVAILASIHVVRAFVAFRRELMRHEDLREWLRDVERRLLLTDLRGRKHDKIFEEITPLLERIQHFLESPPLPDESIGFILPKKKKSPPRS